MDKFTVERELKDLTHEEVMRIYDLEPIDSARKPRLREEVLARMNKSNLYYGNQLGQQQTLQQQYLGKGISQAVWNGKQ